MPLTQARMLALITAGDQMLHAHRRLVTETRQHILRVNEDITAGLPPPDLIRELETMLYQIELHGPSHATIDTIAEERGHFQSVQGRNNSARINMQKLRRRRNRPPDGDDLNDPVLRAAGEPGTVLPIPVPAPPPDLERIHQQCFDVWQDQIGYNPHLAIATIVDILKTHGLKREVEQAPVVEVLMKSGILIQQQRRSEFTVLDPST